MAPPPAALPTMSKQSTPKAMSSRLMTMKFMQRGEILNSPASDSGSPMTPKTDDEEGSAAKRRKLSRASAPNTPNTPAAPLYDQKALQAAIAEEETKRLAAIEKRAAELGDSHWVLDTVSASSKSGPHRSLNIVQVGFAQIDSSGTSEENTDSPGTGSQPAPAPFRQFNMKKAKTKQEDEGNSGSDSSDNDSHQASSPVGKKESDRGRRDSASEAIRKRARSSVSTPKGISQGRKKEVNLNKLTSISSSGPAQQSPQFTCRYCGKPGHKALDCPRKGQ